MEIPAGLFFSFWALISITFLHLGLNALDKTELSNSVSPVVMSFFKHSLAISSISSSSYALIFRPQVKLAVERRYFWVAYGSVPILIYSTIDETVVWGVLMCAMINFFAWLLHFLPELKIFADRYSLIMTLTFFSSALFPWYFPISTLINFFLISGEYRLTPEQKNGIFIHMAVESSLFLVSGNNTKFFPILVLFVSFLISAYWAALSGFEPFTCVSWDPLSGDESFQKLLPVAAKGKEMLSILMEKKTGKLIKFAVGMGGSVLFQNFFRLTSFSHVVAFLYLAVAWVANLALLGVSGDFGVLNFLIGNVVVGCTVSQFGLRGTTWLAYGASLLLYGLRLKLESLTLVYREAITRKLSVIFISYFHLGVEVYSFSQVKIQDDRYHIWIAFALLPPLMYTAIGGPILIYFPIYGFAYFYEIATDPGLSAMIEDGVGLGVDFVVKFTMLCFGGHTKFIPLLVLLIACYTSAVWAAMSEEESLYEMLPVVAPEKENTSFLKKKKKSGKLVQFGVGILEVVLFQRENQSSWRRILNERRKLIEFAVGMVGTILFQNFFRLTSFNHVLAFLYLAVAWLGNLALLRASGDLGVFNFLLGNVIVGCTVSQFGLHGTTWLAYGASILLYGLRLKLESMSLVDRGEAARVIVCNIHQFLPKLNPVPEEEEEDNRKWRFRHGCFFSFWALIGAGSLFLGIDALDKTDLPNSISPMKSFFFEEYLYKESVVIALFPLLYYLSRGESFGWYFSIYVSNFIIIFQLTFAAVSEEQNGLFIHFAAMSSLFLVGGKIKYFPILVLFFAFFTSVAWAAICGDERFQKWLPPVAARENRILSNLKKIMKKNGKVIEFGIGMADTILFQNFFRLTSFDHVAAFLYLAVAWLANLALLLPPHDLGIFNFFLSNVIVGCTVSQFGLRGTTWLAYGASLLLYSLRLKLESLSLVNRGEDEAAVVVWRQ
ncbi:hypothetical protein Pfo_025404 [Paulownia fortunei]|nr:hypothetical protein Pfo_025404 [Paulownia fortunei]